MTNIKTTIFWYLTMVDPPIPSVNAGDYQGQPQGFGPAERVVADMSEPAAPADAEELAGSLVSVSFVIPCGILLRNRLKMIIFLDIYSYYSWF